MLSVNASSSYRSSSSPSLLPSLLAFLQATKHLITLPRALDEVADGCLGGGEGTVGDKEVVHMSSTQHSSSLPVHIDLEKDAGEGQGGTTISKSRTTGRCVRLF